MGMFCLSAFVVLFAGVPDKKPKAVDPSEQIVLIHTDVLYKNYQDMRADVLVGHVQLYHDGMYLDCDSARFYREENNFYAYGHVKMKQGDTLSLVCDTLLYDGMSRIATTQGPSTLTHKKMTLKARDLVYDRNIGVGKYDQHGEIKDGENTLNSEWGQYTPATSEAIFTYNVVLENPKFTLKTNSQLYYYSNTKLAQIVDSTNIVSSDGTFVYAQKGTYDTRTGQASLMDRSHIYKDMRDIVGDSLYSDKITGVSEAFGNVILTDVENMCMLTGNYCRYEEPTGLAVATDSAVCYEFSGPDTLYVHADTLKMMTHNAKTDSVYRDLFGYHKVRMFRNDFQGVCDSLVSHEKDSCTYLYGQPILWNEGQQVFGEEIRVYNNDSTIDWIHIINQAMTIERLDSVSYNQVASKEMFCFFENGEIKRNVAKGNVYVSYFMDESDGNRIGMNYTETPELILYMVDKKVDKIWMSTATGTMYPAKMVPTEKRYLKNFAWFDYIRPKDKDDIFEWRDKSKENMLKTTEKKFVPIQRLDKIK